MRAVASESRREEMNCPRCSAVTDGSTECPRCGVVIAKARPPRPQGRPAAAPADRGWSPWRSLLLPGLGFVALAAAALVHFRAPDRRTDSEPSRLAPAARPSAPERDQAPIDPETPSELRTTLVAPPQVDTNALASRAVEADTATARRLADRLGTNAVLGAQDLQAAEDLFTRYGEPARGLLEAVLVKSAQRELQARRHEFAAMLLNRALGIAPESVVARRALLAVRVDQGDWPAAEAVARAVLAAVPADAEATRTLAFALVRQDRSREAVEILTAFLDGGRDSQVQALLERIRHDDAAEAGLGQQKLAHFHVRYDGAAHEDVGREVLRVLERHYAALTLTLDHRPSEPIPVILLSDETYYRSTGAPAWSGGEYDHFDGRVRIPIGGVTAALTPELEETVVHELAHAFVVDRSAGLVPKALNEGLAQYVSGRRSAAVLGEDGLRALASGRLGGVPGFYLEALAFVEDLVAQRGQGGINELLAAMARTRDVDGSFRAIYGKDMSALHAEWSARLRRRYSYGE